MTLLVCVKEYAIIRKSPGNNRIGMKQYSQLIEAGIFVIIACDVLNTKKPQLYI